MRRTLFLVLSLVVSAVVLYFSVQGIPLDGLAERISSIDWLWLSLLILIIPGGLWARGIRWQGLLGHRLTFWQAFHSSNIMFMLNFLPLRLGEVARAVIASRYQVPFVTAATGVLVERIIDTVLVFVVLSFSLARLPQAPALATQSATLLGVAAVAAFISLLVMARFPNLANGLLSMVERWLPFLKRLPLRRILDDILRGLKPLTHWRGAAHVLGWTFIAWTFSFSGYYVLQRALGITNIDLWLNSFFSIALIAFSIAIPVTIASIGPFQAAARIGAETLGLTAAEGLALGVVYHVVTFFVYSAFGVIGLIALGLSLGDVTRSASTAPENTPGSTS